MRWRRLQPAPCKSSWPGLGRPLQPTQKKSYIFSMTGSAMIGAGSTGAGSGSRAQAAARTTRPRTMTALMLLDIFVSLIVCAGASSGELTRTVPRTSDWPQTCDHAESYWHFFAMNRCDCADLLIFGGRASKKRPRETELPQASGYLPRTAALFAKSRSFAAFPRSGSNRHPAFSGRRARQSTSTRAPTASAVTPIVVLAGSLPSVKWDR